MKRFFVPILALILPALAAAQITNVRFISEREEPIFTVKRIYAEESKNLTSDLSMSSLSLELIAMAPGEIELPVGIHLLNVGGVTNFNRVFPLLADGRPKDVRILGDPRKEILYGILSLAAGAVLVPSILALSNDLRGGENLLIGAGLYGTLGGGALLYLGIRGMVAEYPRVEVSDR